MLVLDASIALAWGLADESSDFAQAVLELVDLRGCRVPSLWVTEVLNGTVMAVRRKRFTVDESDRFLNAIESLHRRRRIQVVEVGLSRSFAGIPTLAATHGLTAYDAAYLLLAQSESLPLATADRILAAAARRVGVDLLPQ